jgi:HK97 family phage prohead protease
MEARAYSTFAVKSLDDEQRWFTGLATSPVPDRVGDIVDPLGVRYRNPTVLLHQHRHDSPIGEVRFARPSSAGVGFTAKIPKISEPGPLRDRVDTAWGEVKHGLVRAVSIGFRLLESEPLPTGGLRIKKCEIIELSTVSVPAQALATIDQVKAIDAAVRRGEAPSLPLAGSLWRKVADAGQAAMDQTQASEEFQRAKGAFGTAMVAGNMSSAMIRSLAGHVEELEWRLTERGANTR